MLSMAELSGFDRDRAAHRVKYSPSGPLQKKSANSWDRVIWYFIIAVHQIVWICCSGPQWDCTSSSLEYGHGIHTGQRSGKGNGVYSSGQVLGELVCGVLQLQHPQMTQEGHGAGTRGNCLSCQVTQIWGYLLLKHHQTDPD